MQNAAQSEIQPLVSADEMDESGIYHGRVVDYGSSSLLERIAKWASVNPAAPAIEYGEIALSYADLLQQVDRCAAWMREHGVSDGGIVALDLERSAQLVVAMLATWRAGAAFLPLEPSWPARRVEGILDAAKPALVVHAASATDTERRQGVWRQAMFPDLATGGADALYEGVSLGKRSAPGDLAYVLFTSGSTGTPKGVMVEHRQVLNYAAAVSEALNLGENRRWGVLGSLAVDLGYTGLFGALLNGACLVIASATDIQDGRAFARFVRNRNIDCVKIVPSYLDALLDTDDAALPRKLILGGEATPQALLRRTWKIAPSCRIFNHYGPTETTVGVMVHEADPRNDSDAVLPLSVVLPNCRIYVLNDELRSVSIGELGKVYVAGAQICRGYMGGQNSGAFSTDPFYPSERLYATGDLAYRVPEGGIRLAGRADHQVKVLGFRVELAEIEAVLLEQDGVRQAVVVTGRDVGADIPLVAFIVAGAAPGSEEEQKRLRSAVAAKLPTYMQPGAYVFMDELPRLPSGKIDRRALRMQPAATLAREIVAPGDQLQSTIVSCMAELLKRDSISLTDDFFELGGNSLLVIKLIARLRKRLGVDVSPATVFEHSSPERLAAAIRESTGQHGHGASEKIEAIDRSGPLPLSPAQTRQWFLWQLDPASTAYHTGGALRLAGALDVTALRLAFERISARHESLRTVFRASADGLAEQVIQQPGGFSLSELDLSDRAPDDAEVEAEKSVQRITRAPFDLTRGPLFRVALIRVAPESHVLAVSMHHIISDGWSMQVIVDEFVELYRAHVERRAPDLKPLPIQYADFATWQKHWLEAGAQGRQLAYWKQRLGDEHPVLQLPADRPRPAEPKYSATHHTFELPVAFTESLRLRARESRATLFMVLLTAFQILLKRYTGQSDIRVGTTNANRTRQEVQGVVGFFVNTQVLRSEVDDRLSFDQLLAQTREAVVAAQEHQDLPFDQLVEALQPERSLERTPLFQVLMNHQQQDFQQLVRLPGLTLDRYELGEQGSKFELTLTTTERADGRVSGSMTYAAELFERESIARLVEHYIEVLTAIAERSRQRIAEMELASASNRELLQHSKLRDEIRSPQSVPKLMERGAQQVPNLPALICGREEYSYAELNQRASQLAHQLISLGVKPEIRVGIHAPRSIEFVVGVLAVWKAGGVYVPLDPQHPTERLAYQLQDSDARVLLSTSAVKWTGSVPVIDIASEREGEAMELPEPHAAQSAYVIYTSGSTGQPKGVVVSHGALRNYVQGLLQRLALPDDVRQFAMVSTVSADLGHTVLFGALCSGRTLHLISPECTSDPDRFAAYMSEHRIEVLKIVPSHLQALLSAAKPELVLPRHTLILGGEATSWALLNRIRELAPHCRVINHYGPTETTVGVLTHDASQARLAVAKTLPIGAPLPNTQCYVLDAYMNRTPRGVHGELYIGGAGLAHGYQDRGGLTAERFVASPFEAGERLYRTGDRVRVLTDGCVEFLGRVDDQVKVRGYRVELKEVARRLEGMDGVDAAEVIARAEDGRVQLHAYVASRSHAKLDAQALRQRLSTLLPEYMVPSAIVAMESLPLTANGKVDRRALPEPSRPTDSYEPPQGEIEQALAAIWTQALNANRVGRHDNFFELGGDSIICLQIVARAHAAGWKITLAQMFSHQTIARLAAVAEPLSVSVLLDEEPESSSEPFALTPIQRWFFEQNFDEPHHWNLSLMLEPTEAVDVATLQRGIEQLIEHHDALRMSFQQIEGEWRQHYQQSIPDGCFEVVDLSAEKNIAEGIARAAEQAQRSLTLHQPFRAVWIELGRSYAGRLLLAAHHLVVDGVSWRVLLSDLQHLYVQLREGRAAALPAKSASFRRWSRALREHAGNIAADELPYWRMVVDAAERGLPCSKPHGSNTVADEVSLSVTFGESVTERLLANAPQAYRTQINDLLLTALVQTLCRWSERESVLIELEGHGRDELSTAIDVSRTVGWFTSLHPVRLTPHADPALSIKTIKEQLRAVPNKGLGYGLLRYLVPEGAVLAEGAYPQVTFNYLGQFDQSFDAASMWRVAKEKAGPNKASRSGRRCWFNVSARVYERRLSLQWTYSSALHGRAEIERLLQSFRANLEQLIDHCTSGVVGITPWDVPLAQLTQTQLDALPIPAAQIDDLYPMTPLQQGLLFHSLQEPHADAYMRQLRADVEGLDVARFESAWRAVIERHEVLRAGVLHELHPPAQWVAKEIDVPLVEEDWRDCGDPRDALDARAQEELARGFEFSKPPLMRFVVIRTQVNRYHFIWTRHHVLLDGWSTAQIMSEVLQHYTQGALPALRGRYRDYVAWLQGRNRQESEQYWKSRLQPLEEPTRLASALSKPEGGQDYGEHVEYVGAESTRLLLKAAKRERVTLNTLVQGAWALLLSGYTHQRCVAFGAATAGRPPELHGVEQLVGLFINTFPVIAELRAEQSVGDWLRELQAQNVASREHDHTALQEIQRWAGYGGQSLFDVLLAFQNYPIDEALRGAGDGVLKFSSIEHQDTTHYPMTVQVSHGDTFWLRYRYRREYIDDKNATDIARRISQLLLALAADGRRSVGEIKLVDDAEDQHLRRLSERARSFASAEPLHRLIERQISFAPQSPALICGEEVLSYGELNARANRLAHYLIAQGVRPEVRVGVAMERSPDLVVGLLAILKAGGAYVPLDPAYPPERLSYLMRDSGIELLLTQSWIVDRLPSLENVKALPLDALAASDALDAPEALGAPGAHNVAVASDLHRASENNPAVSVHPGNLAYVIYTSGSTGQPKGAQLTHRNVSRLLAATQEWFHFDARDVWTLFHSYAFDFSVWEIFGALCYGGRLVIVPYEVSRSPEEFVGLLRREQVTVLNQTPSAFRQLMQVPAVYSCGDLSLRAVIFGGEALDPQSLRPWLEHFSDQKPQLINMYGITETTVHVTYRPITTTDLSGPRSPIGEGIADLGLRVLDAHLNAVPLGVPGELYVSGAGLARGYLKRGGLSAQRFVADPFSAHGERLYRTGDQVRRRHDGKLEYLGRIDQQVKIRGFRIELGEIESQLLAQPEVREAVVIAQEHEGDQQLLAYVVGSTDTEIDSDAIRDRLSRALPSYMMPRAVISLPSLPLTANGKLDRRALPEARYAQTGNYQAPQGEIEQTLAAIWEKVLGVEKVGRHDNLFERGGHSLLILQLASRLRRKFDCEVPMRKFFELPLLVDFSEWLSGQVRSTSSAGVIERLPVTEGELSSAQQRMWFMWQLAPHGSTFNISRILRLTGELSERALRQSLETLLQRHEILRTVFEDHDGVPTQKIVAMPLPYSVRDDFSDLETALATVRAVAREPFDLQRGPLWRVSLLRLAPREHVLAVTMHHIIVDGWSLVRIVTELSRLYAGYAVGYEAVLPDIPIRYLDYAAWQRRWLKSSDAARQLDYWRRRLAGNLPAFSLPHDVPPGDSRSRPVAVCNGVIDAAATRRLHELSRKYAVTPYMFLLAASSVVMRARCGLDSFVVGADMAGRDHVETEHLIGFFVNQVVVALDCGKEESWVDRLWQVRDTLLDASHNQALPFERVVDALRTKGRAIGAPLFAVKVLYQLDSDSVTFPGVDVTDYASGAAQAELDLIISFVADGPTLRIVLKYDAEVYRPATMQSFERQLAAVLQACLADPTVSTAVLTDIVASAGMHHETSLLDNREQKMATLRSKLKRGRAAAATFEEAPDHERHPS